MEEILNNLIVKINDTKIYIIIPISFIFLDIEIRYIRAFKNKKVNSDDSNSSCFTLFI